jgi:biopolymer transport protein ExbD
MQGEEEEAGVMMAPLIDCVFILLVFFLVTSMLQKPHKELPIRLPHAGAGEVAKEEQDPLVVLLTPINPDISLAAKKVQGTVFEPYIVIEKDLVTKELLERRIRQVAKENPERRIRVQCEGRLAWRHVVPILDLCRLHGLNAVAVRISGGEGVSW